jgi:hypothetical protein
MDIYEFNEKWKVHLEPGHYGLDIDNQNVIDYLDKTFIELKEKFSEFQYSQIKLKFGRARVYMEPYEINTNEIESNINKIIQNI